MRRGVAVSRIAQTGHSDDSPPRRMGRCGEADQARLAIDRGGLHGRDLVAAKRLAHDVKAVGQRRIAKGLILIAWVRGANGRNQCLLRIGARGCAKMMRLGRYPRADLRGRPPFAPFNRAAAALAGDFVRPAMRASWFAVHLRIPKMPDTKAGQRGHV
jgi:hypothetical protein